MNTEEAQRSRKRSFEEAFREPRTENVTVFTSGQCQPALLLLGQKPSTYLCWSWVAFKQPQMEVLSHQVCIELMQEGEFISDAKASLLSISSALKWVQASRWTKDKIVSIQTDNSSACNQVSGLWPHQDQLSELLAEIRQSLSTSLSLSSVMKRMNPAVPLTVSAFKSALSASNPSNNPRPTVPLYPALSGPSNPGLVQPAAALPKVEPPKSTNPVNKVVIPSKPFLQPGPIKERREAQPAPQFKVPSTTTKPKSATRSRAKNQEPAKPPGSTKLPFFQQMVITDDEFEKFLPKWESMKLFSWYFHYTSLIKKNAKDKSLDEEMYSFLPGRSTIDGMVVCWNPEVVFFVSLKESRSKGVTSASVENRWATIKRIMGSDAHKVCFQAKPQLKILLSYGVSIHQGLRDPKIAAWVLDSERNKDKDLDQLYEEYTHDKAPLHPDGSYNKAFVHVNRSLKLMSQLQFEFNSKAVEHAIFEKLEMQITPILAMMEFCGVGFDSSTYNAQSDQIKKKIETLEQRAFKLAGKEFQLTSPAEVGQVLFNHLKIPYPVPNSKSLSTKAEILQAVAHPLASIVLQHRKLSHTINTYLDSLPKYSFFNSNHNMQRIYSTILQTTVPTGRLAFTDPNLQSITHSFEFSPARDSPHSGDSASPMCTLERFFVDIDHWFLSADFSQLELRIMAHFSQDQKLLNIFKQPNCDIFIMMASEWKKKPPADVTPCDRAHTKHICYGILYGMGPTSLAGDMEVPKGEAVALIKSFKNVYSGVRTYLKKVVQDCKNKGYVETIRGRRRYLPNIFSSDFKSRSYAERQSINTVCQGSAADICKQAMIDIVNYLKEKSKQSKILLQLHDEILLEVPLDEVDELKQVIPKLMTGVGESINLSISLPVKVVLGNSWGSLTQEPMDVITSD